MRGAERRIVSALLLASGVATGAAVGFAAGVAWRATGAPATATGVAAVLVVFALAADAVHRRTGRLRPLSVPRQVPQPWGRLLSPGTVAVVYGARLGVGPLTRLATWVWWAAAVVSASAGPWHGAAAGAVFAATRTATMFLAVAGAGTGDAMSRRMATVRRHERAAHLLCTAAAAAGLVVLATW